MSNRPKLPAGTERPSFPVRLKADAGMPSATKLIADKPRAISQLELTLLRTPVQSAALAAVKAPLFSPEIDPARHAPRARMVQKLAAQGVSDSRVLAAMGAVERHRFVDTALGNQAYEDTSLPIGLGQTISKPNVVARMLELLGHGRRDASGKLGRVLEIGTGCGYQAAVLSHLATEVYSIERLRGMHDKARENLRTLRLANVHLLFGDGMVAYAKGAPYAAIIAAAGGEAIPEAWIEQLAIGGRLVAPLQIPGGAQALVIVDKTSQGLRQTVLEAVNFVPLKSGTN